MASSSAPRLGVAVACLAAAIATGPAAAADAAPELDAALAAALSSGAGAADIARSYRGRLDAAQLTPRLLIASALDKLASARSDPETMTAGQAQILKSTFDVIGAESAIEDRQRAAHDLAGLARALWRAYVAPLADDARKSGLLPIGATAQPLVHRWYDTATPGRLTVFELVPKDDGRNVDWVITPLDGRSTLGQAVLRAHVAGAAKGETPPKLLAYLELSGLGAGAAQAAADLGAANPRRLAVEIESNADVVAQCVAAGQAEAENARRARAEDQPTALGAAIGTGLRGAVAEIPAGKKASQPPAKAAPEPPSAAELQASCATRHPPAIGATAVAVLVDPRRQVDVRVAPLAGVGALDAFLRFAAGLAKDWP